LRLDWYFGFFDKYSYSKNHARFLFPGMAPAVKSLTARNLAGCGIGYSSVTRRTGRTTGCAGFDDYTCLKFDDAFEILLAADRRRMLSIAR
jgi:hypothetical protein